MKLSYFLAIFCVCLFVDSFILEAIAQENTAPPAVAEVESIEADAAMSTSSNSAHSATTASTGPSQFSRATVLVFSLTVFALAIFVGFEVIAKVPPTLHTPLMSGSNAISGVTVVGAIIAAGNESGGIACLFALIAVALATVNVFGGFVVTYRMLLMFKKR